MKLSSKRIDHIKILDKVEGINSRQQSIGVNSGLTEE